MTRQEHLLTILAEECAEVAQRVSKALRFSLTEIQPGQPLTNAERIVEELNHMSAMYEMLEDAGILKEDPLNSYFFQKQAKKQKVEKFLELSKAQGTLTAP